MANLSRLDAILSCVPSSHTVADIGTDHGYVPVNLIKKNIAEYVIATDISSSSLAKAETLIEMKGMGDRISTRVGYGLSILKPDEVDTAIIAGLGGVLISEILEKDRLIAGTIDTFILQPMKWRRLLREYLLNNGYTIVDEVLVKESISRYYVIMVVKHGKEKVKDDLDYYLGRRLIEKKDPLLPGYILHNIKRRQDILDNLRYGKPNLETQRKQFKLKEEIEKLKEVYENVCTD